MQAFSNASTKYIDIRVLTKLSYQRRARLVDYSSVDEIEVEVQDGIVKAAPAYPFLAGLPCVEKNASTSALLYLEEQETKGCYDIMDSSNLYHTEIKLDVYQAKSLTPLLITDSPLALWVNLEWHLAHLDTKESFSLGDDVHLDWKPDTHCYNLTHGGHESRVLHSFSEEASELITDAFRKSAVELRALLSGKK